MSRWQFRTVPFSFQLSDLTLFTISLPLQVRAERLIDDTPPVTTPNPPIDELTEGSQGFLIRALPLVEQLPALRRVGDYICYVRQQYEHCYIDLSIGFERYRSKFSAKTRSTIQRKLRKYEQHCNGPIVWKTFRSPEDIEQFLQLALPLSKVTYQERLLSAGLPNTPAFRQQAVGLAQADQVRAYLLFHGERPVSYLYCPVDHGVLSYSYVGYDPEYMNLSPGTVLQWLAIEQLFEEKRFRYFDFTEGQSEHKRLFATNQQLCGNICFIKYSLRNRAMIYCHRMVDTLSRSLGKAMEDLGLKARIKRLIRFTH
ncbi:GNAT family N-acetyltransferase [Chitinivorax sp. B]|uniref:GNAT family N-acetyltransferase n=1 Tax=Chitinivorax sp. B TaxID=2502235 RepID=UPI0010FA31DD|nr:GNAT family N-acetyltransferase [Chitinivorax sp. B]